MTVVTDIADDLTLIDGLRSITVSLVHGSGTTSVSVASAQREPVRKGMQLFSGVMLQGNETLWHIPDSLLNPSDNGRVIDVNDEITDGSTVYNVIAATKSVMGTVWSCACNLRV